MVLACLEAVAARDTESRYRVLLSSPTNWLSCECVLLQKYTCSAYRGFASHQPRHPYSEFKKLVCNRFFEVQARSGGALPASACRPPPQLGLLQSPTPRIDFRCYTYS